MGHGQRLGLILAAIAVSVVAFVLLQPEDSDDDDTQPAQTTATAPQTAPDEREPTATVEVPNPPPRVETIRVAGGEPAGGVKRITLEKGEQVRLTVRSDVAVHVHVHGYDLFKDVAPGTTARFRFRANIEGVFEIELEDSHTPIGELVVEP